MVLHNKIRIITVLIFISLFTSLAYSAFPQFQYNENSYGSGQVDVNFRVSSGTQVSLFINGNYVGNKNVVSQTQDYEIDGTGLANIDVPIGSKLNIKNMKFSGQVKLNISALLIYNVLNIGNSYEFSSYNEGSYTYRDEVTGDSATIYVIDELVDASFPNVEQTSLNEGTNTIKFEVKSLKDNTLVYEEQYSVTYNKYSNQIFLTNYTTITQQSSTKIIGSVSQPGSPLTYIVNHDGTIINTGMLTNIALDGNNFNIEISSLREGNNSIRFISLDPINNAIFDGESKINIFVDTIPPEIKIKSISYSHRGEKTFINPNEISEGIYTNENKLTLNISSDADTFIVEINGKNTSHKIVNNTIQLDLTMVKGQNNITFTALDKAGNKAKESHQMFYDNTPINLEEIDPDKGSTVHFFLQDFEGKVNKPNAQITMFTMPKNAEYFVTDANGKRQSQKATCQDYEFIGYRAIGKFDEDKKNNIGLKTEEVQISLLDLISEKRDTKSDSSGDFEIENMILLEDDISEREVDQPEERKKSEVVGSVKSENRICIVMSDNYGNVNTEEIRITLDAGNTMWKIGEVTTIPNSVYASEIEMTGGKRSGSGKVRSGVIARFTYIGSGKIDKFTSVRISTDKSFSEESKNGNVVTNELNFRLDKDTNELIVYFPLEINPLNKEPLDYPDSLTFGFAAMITYTVDDVDIPIDTKNPVYFQTKLNIERPLDHAKWLTPNMIEKTLDFLNKSIAFTKSATTWLSYASVGGVVACTGARFWHAWEVSQAALLDDKEKELKIKEADHTLYMICDRVASTAAPYQCDLNGKEDGFLSKEQYENGVEYKDGDIPVGVFKPSVGGDCTTDKGESGKYVSGTGFSYEEKTSFGTQKTIEKEVYFRKDCLPEKDGKIDFGKVKGNICYSPGAPEYDDTRCNFFGLDSKGSAEDNWAESGVSGKDPSTSIISAIRCGAITDTYSHTKNYLKIQEGIKKCLEQAKIGNTKGGYCERLMGQAVCDIATNVILPELQQNINPRQGASKEDVERNPFTSFLGQMKANEKSFNDRYAGSVYSKAGLSTNQIINKACIGAITGDWSVLTENILTSIDQNEVDPVFGPPLPESRLQGYNPLTGQLDIRYLFTYAVVSGGQRVDSEFELICDPNGPNGEYCPDDQIVSSANVPGSKFKSKRLYTSAGGVVQENVIISDNGARFWYNKLKVTHKYKVKGESKTDTTEFSIIHKEELFAQCYFTAGTMGSGAGLGCDHIFDDEAALMSNYVIDSKITEIFPKDQNTFFPGNSLWVNLGFSVQNVQQFNQEVSLAYMAVCNEGKDNEFYVLENGNPTPYQSLYNDVPVSSGRKLVKLFDSLPDIGSEGEEEFEAKLDSIPEGDFNAIKFTSLSGIGSPSISVREIKIGDKIIENFPAPYIKQNLKVNDVETDNSFVIIDKLEMKKGEKIEIKFNKKIENVEIQVISINGDEIIASNSGFKIENGEKASEGTCNLYMRILPKSQAENLRKDNFKTFNAVSNSDEEGNIVTNVKVSDAYKTTFSYKKPRFDSDGKPLENTNYFDISKPYESYSHCVNKNELGSSIDIPLEYVFQNSGNSKTIPTITYSIRSPKYGIVGEGDISNNKIKIEDSGLINELEAEEEKSFTEYFVFGSKPSQQLTLEYTLKTSPEKKGSVKFGIYTRDNCASTQDKKEDETPKTIGDNVKTNSDENNSFK
ncbi:MAG: hypothetical protein KC550_00945 [Nanoarchaeota archaeon]|nr:hypothetical protein [Nanoarchaeota archaeon]